MTMGVSAQISVYPLRQKHLGPAVEAVRHVLMCHGLQPETGPMSTLASGDCYKVFSALGEAFESVAAEGEVVMTVAVSNACPVENSAGDALADL